MYRYPAAIQNEGIAAIHSYIVQQCHQFYPSTPIFPNPFNCEQVFMCMNNNASSNYATRNCGTSLRGIQWPGGACVLREESHCDFYPLPPT
nr:hypothetical protein PPFHPHBJ_00043 [Cydia pomonella granulovirus]WOZ44819.1 hypothetical protein HDNAPKKO_00045 [Cydia pomonella granulovirus]WOZ44955.1 hypothetical protein GGGKFHNK_00043 [Cydia pomonella granulovirus]WOZ45091.1 hypothetical protein BGFFOGFG_00043 [Cydia pomonella granulovirus]WOZ45612.1 hypothetical protein AAGMHLIN_00041 [Cydia pomonella granulovirus]